MPMPESAPVAVIDLDAETAREPVSEDRSTPDPSSRGLWRYAAVALASAVLAAAVTFWGVQRWLTPEAADPIRDSAELARVMEDELSAELGAEPELMVTLGVDGVRSSLEVIPAGRYRVGLLCGVLNVYGDAPERVEVYIPMAESPGFLMPCPSTLVWAEEEPSYTEDTAMELSVDDPEGFGAYVVHIVFMAVDA
ncbi:hypothetical protein LX16_3819 [Stackebrandtia albiflava]|uniref:Uncharacterized protein n=1 Tax=Stackebrandtia albiflava TaxID=406432 RepID=A0A562V575_9ACTN|nr:hypothetical protein [Stackebrandtia albiflava]TWJ13051.1 hypothetical protein LX16_3819 [Stackebrandtia albiflava]